MKKIIRLMSFLTILFFGLNALAQTKKSPTASDYSKTPELQLAKDFEAVKAGITGILTDKVEILDKKNQLILEPREVMVMDDKIVMKSKKQSMVINFTDFIDDNIYSPGYRKAKIILVLDKYEFVTNGWVTSNLKRLEELRQDLLFLQNQTRIKRYESQLVLFKPVAEQYRELKVKPQVSEEQRKIIVQANLFNQQKMYDKAIELYQKAIEAHQTAYPAGYSNLALLSAQINNYDAAIYYMKKYLLLDTDGSDSRSAQDKIYEWEALIAK